MRTLVGVILVGTTVALVIAALFDTPKQFVASLVCQSGANAEDQKKREMWIVDTFGKLGEFWISPCVTRIPTSLSGGGVFTHVNTQDRRDGRRLARLDREYAYCYDPNGAVIKVPADFYTDFASIPAFSRFLFDPMGDQIEAAILHDWLYSVGEVKPAWTRLEADNLFRFMLAESGVNIVRRNVMYWAVRLFAGPAYNSSGDIDMRKSDWTAYSIPRPVEVSSETLTQCRGFNEARQE